MQAKTQSNVPPADKPTEIAKHLQNMTDDLKQAINGGLSIADNLPFTLYRAQFTSDTPVAITGKGGCVVFSDSPITKTTWRTINSTQFELTLTCDAATTSAVILITKENAP